MPVHPEADTFSEHPNLHLSPEERRYFGQLFTAADTDKIGVVTGEVAVRFFEKTRLSSDVLGEIWQIADSENRGLLTPAGFGIVLRLIGYAQAGRPVSSELALKRKCGRRSMRYRDDAKFCPLAGGPLPKFDNIPLPGPTPSAAPLQAQSSGGPIRVPPLAQDKVAQFASLFDESGAQNGLLSGRTAHTEGRSFRMTDTIHVGENARSIFERAQLPNDVLGRIWNLADTEQKGSLGLTEFIIAMHLLSSFKNGSMRALPQILPAGLYEAAARRGVPRQNTGSRPTSDNAPASAIPRQFSGAGFSPQARQPQGSYPPPAQAGDQWLISPQDKTQFDQIYTTVDTQNRGFITGEQAVGFFSNSRLPEDALAQIWDLADINSEGQLNRDEFAVAMYLIRQQRSKRDGRDVLPQSLPPNLIPPSMRRQPIAPQQPTAPAFDNAANISKPKSASEDLFGLDAITEAPSTSDATNGQSAFPSSPPAQAPPSSVPATTQQPSHFKPFIPSSSFGQAMMSPQQTNTSTPASTTQNRGVTSTPTGTGLDDLLGDNDPEVSKRLTNETSDLGNLSNQVSTLTTQMSEVRNHKDASEQNLAQSQSQKRDFELRLSQLRAAYQQEVKEVQALEESLRTSREQTKRLQTDFALIQGTHQDLQTQHQQIAQALRTDQQENASLKEKISQANADISDMKPRLEKLRMDARQQKGLVAIYRKQLAGSDNERQNMQSDIDGTTKELGETTRELEENRQAAEAVPKAQETFGSQKSVASPTPSTTSMNPFLRSTSHAGPSTIESMASPPLSSRNEAAPNHHAFDNFFGSNNVEATRTSSGEDAPSISRHVPHDASDTLQAAELPHPADASYEHSKAPTEASFPSGSSVTQSTPRGDEPPAPPQSRQITSSFLPFRPNLEHTGSDSSSVKVLPPASRMGERSVSEFDTPSDSFADSADRGVPRQHFEGISNAFPSEGSQFTPPSSDGAPATASHGPQSQVASFPEHLTENSGLPSASREVPGAFPGDETPVKDIEPSFASASGPYSSSGVDPRVDSVPRSTDAQPSQTTATDPFARTPSPVAARDDFDSAFAHLDKGKAPEHRTGHAPSDAFSEAPVESHGEFPPIREFGDENESDSEEERGFDDDFTQHSANRTIESGPNQSLQASSAPENIAPSRPPFNTTASNLSQLPTPGAQQSPPTYDQTIGSPPNTHGDRKDSNQFPKEYSGLLPSRDDPTSPSIISPQTTSNITESAGIDRGLNFFGNDSLDQTVDHATTSSGFTSTRAPMSIGASTSAPYAYSQSPSAPRITQGGPTASVKSAPKDEFDDEFGDLTEAKEDVEDEDAMAFSRSRNETDDFNPVFDSPAPAHNANHGSSGNAAFPRTDSFADFEASPSGGAGNRSLLGGGSTAESSNHDWDAIFAGLDGPSAENGAPAEAKGLGFSPQKLGQSLNTGTATPRNAGATEPTGSSTPDDPILSRLTGMGYPRQQSLNALEKFDYNIDKVS